MRQVKVDRGQTGVFVSIGDPDARDNSTRKIMLSESEAALLYMKLKIMFNKGQEDG